MFADLPSAPLHPLRLPWLAQAGVECAILRLDLIEAGAPGLISLGGNHSNHLHALAAAGRRFGFATAGLLRGHRQDTPTVRDLEAFGMQLHWLGYAGYRARHHQDFWRPWQAPSRPVLDWVHSVGRTITPGGWQLGPAPPWLAWCRASRARIPCTVRWRSPKTTARRRTSRRWSALRAITCTPLAAVHAACRGGFARIDEALLDFIAASERHSEVPLEALYTGKALLALREQVEAGRFARGTRLIFVHTGGLQGRRGYL